MAKQQRALRTRRQLLEAAAAVFDERGYGAATLDEILARAGLTRGALYFHFSSKEALAAAVFADQMAPVKLPAQSTRLQELIDHGLVLAHRLQHDPLVRASVRLSMNQGAGAIDGSDPYRAWIDHNTRLLREAQGQGELLPHVDPQESAAFLAAAFTGVQTVSQALTGWLDVGERTQIMLQHVLPSIAMPALLPVLDLAAERGAELLKGASHQEQ